MKYLFAFLISTTVQASECPMAFQKLATSCRISKSGLIGTLNNERLTYKLFCLTSEIHPGEFCDSAIQIQSAGDSSAKPNVLFSRIDINRGLIYQVPELQTFSSQPVLAVFASVNGTSHWDETEYFAYTKKAWLPIESKSWLRELVKTRIPKGLEARKGTRLDSKTMVAETALYQSEDANCCPTGGKALVQLRLDGQSLKISSVRFLSPTQAELENAK